MSAGYDEAPLTVRNRSLPVIRSRSAANGDFGVEADISRVIFASANFLDGLGERSN